jgi:8-oxo-dGTP pyrophosphatase MutT (NUDIX family)
MCTRQSLIDQLRSHQPFNEHERDMQAQLLAFVEQHENCFERSLLIGHVTASAWVVNPERTHVLLLHHGKLDKWLQPGGHCDGDEDVLAVARREVSEETGLQPAPVSTEIFDVDAHIIPERKGVPTHVHYDVRFLLEIGLDQAPIVSDESHDVQWVELSQVAARNTDESVLRMVAKTPPSDA